jgi:hypothetical protein
MAVSVETSVMQTRAPKLLDLSLLLPSWELALRSERKSAQTIKSYGDGVRGFLRWCEANGHDPELDRQLVKAWVADLLDAGAEPATARARQLGLRRFSTWLPDRQGAGDDPRLTRAGPWSRHRTEKGWRRSVFVRFAAFVVLAWRACPIRQAPSKRAARGGTRVVQSGHAAP